MQQISPSLEKLAISQLSSIESRLTKARTTILATLESAARPLTVSEIEEMNEDLVQSSIYRNLTVLEQAKLVRKLVSESDFAFYELDEHVLGHHHHLRCISCGNVLDVEVSKETENALHKATKQIAKKFGFAQLDHHLDFTGLCPKCK